MQWARPGAGLVLAMTAAVAPVSAGEPAPTYHKEVERVLQNHCQDCHRPGQVAPFSLLTYDQARKRAGDLADVVASHRMPPWPASTKEGGPFRDTLVLSDSDIQTLAKWAAAGAPAGDPKDAPAPKSWPSDWPLGEPDLVLSVPQAYRLGASGRDEQRVFVVPTNLKEGKWVSAIDIKPGNARIVHHVLCAFDTAGRARKLDASDPESGYPAIRGFGIIPTGGLGGWAPGKRPQQLPDGLGRYLPAGSDVLLQVHYHKSGKEETDVTKVGLYFAKAPVQQQVRGQAVFAPNRPGLLQRPNLAIPAGDPNYEVRGRLRIDRDVHLTALAPHMHWLGKDFTLRANLPDGTSRTLLRIEQWDFNWQSTYDFVSPVPLPKGTTVDLVAHFDNSTDNPANPSNPPKLVRWGEQTTDEMCIGFLQVTWDGERLNNQPPVRFSLPGASEPAPE